jgi:hypothetical protein
MKSEAFLNRTGMGLAMFRCLGIAANRRKVSEVRELEHQEPVPAQHVAKQSRLASVQLGAHREHFGFPGAADFSITQNQ